MKKRKRMSRQRSRKQFAKTAGRTHKRNIPGIPMRGGICL